MKFKIFYGWYMVLAGLALAALNSSIISYGWTAFIGPITTTFGWSMAQISLASSLRSLEVGVFNPLWGPIVDQSSPKKLMLIGVTCSALGIFCLSQTVNLIMYYAGFLILGVGSSLAMGMLPLTVMARWFRKDIGKANGLFYVGTGLGGVAVPLVVFLIDKISWQTTLLYTSIVILLVGIPTSFLYRSRPEDYGMVPDGRVTDGAGKKARPNTDFGTTTKEALRMRAFWHLTVTTIFQSSAMSTVIFYAIPYLTSLGMDRGTAGTVIMLYTFISLFGRILLGTCCDFFRKSYVLAAAIAMQVIGLILYWQMNADSPFWFILLFAIPYGFGVAGVAPLRAPVLADYFGTKNFATIYGLTSIFFAVGNIIPPPLAGWIYDNYHDYKTWWLILIGMGVVALIAALTMPAPQRRPVPEKTEAAPQAK
jgi:sugar phosphate permease